MKIPSLLIVASLLLVAVATAKRAAPAGVAPVVHEGLEYRAPQEKQGVVEAWEQATGKLLWEQQVYAVKRNPQLEQDVQDVFITKLELAAGKLLITNEKQARYALDLKTRKVTQLAKPKGAPKP
ncbi:MAG: hypothetical protein NTY53_25245 [Kiritimatiellaeota bacterium]|nr:hypothetical protein [Kiritimatiellota bacterium]